MRISSRYTPIGVEPVARPSTARLAGGAAARGSAWRCASRRGGRCPRARRRRRCGCARAPVACVRRTREGPRVAERSRASCPAPTSAWAPVTGSVMVVRRSGGERAAAAAAAGGVRILEGEAGALHRRRRSRSIDAADVLRRERIDEHADTRPGRRRGRLRPAASSMRRPYLKPLQPPGCTLTRRPPDRGIDAFLASMNFMTSAPATGVTVIRTSG